ncbi:hypothetical protein LSTR_LSTR010466 [Laodelphax striatellus]|uniref:Uncharacterized protein n=1 Tax=Laodelphax striatellus TaxID=195883 RepID=A0A482X6X2_LAOST|nr:hypothetical protein LSTR_LSTR010466 [Laodelphax striatellus]
MMKRSRMKTLSEGVGRWKDLQSRKGEIVFLKCEISNKKPEQHASRPSKRRMEGAIQGATGQEIDPSMDEVGRCREVVVASGAAELGRICRQLTEADEKEERQLDLISKELSAMQTASYSKRMSVWTSKGEC